MLSWRILLFAGRAALVALVAMVVACGSRSPAQHLHDEAQKIEVRLLAPCCWMQTLDMHESPVATTLRTEIEGRLDRGEAAGAIESDLVVRYGERLRAVPSSYSLDGLPYVGAAALVAFAVVAFLVGRRWVRRGQKTAAARPAPPAAKRGDERLEALLDDELDAED